MLDASYTGIVEVVDFVASTPIIVLVQAEVS